MLIDANRDWCKEFESLELDCISGVFTFKCTGGPRYKSDIAVIVGVMTDPPSSGTSSGTS